jgi:hypothetical protein
MTLPGWLGVASAIIPIVASVRANRSTSLLSAAWWSILAWLGWLLAVSAGWMPFIYLALCLTGCTGVAVLGARRPGAGAWNFVVVGLLVVLMLPIAEAGAADAPVQPGTMRTVFLTSLIGISVINYIPTRLIGGALLLAAGCTVFLSSLCGGAARADLAGWCAGLGPWAAWAGLYVKRRPAAAHDALWMRFRDRYGLIWGLRLREQFDAAALNAGLACRLKWWGVRPKDPAAYDLLAALVKRFFDPSAFERAGP